MAKDSAVSAESERKGKPKVGPPPRKGGKAVDPVEMRMAEAGDWLKKHVRELAIGGGSLIVVVAAVVGYRSYVGSQNARAAKLLAEAVSVATAEVGEPPEDEERPSGERMFKTHKARAQAALRAYRAALTEFPSASIAPRARLGEANALFDLRKLAEAQRAYQEALTAAGDDRPLAAEALQGIGFCLEARNKPADAMRRYEELARLGDDYRPLGEYHQARLHVDAGRRDRALSLLRGIRTRLTRPAAGQQPREGEDEVSPSDRYPFLLAQVQSRLEQLDPEEASNAAGSSGGSGPAGTEELIRRIQQQMGGAGGGVKILGGGRPGPGGSPTKR